MSFVSLCLCWECGWWCQVDWNWGQLWAGMGVFLMASSLRVYAMCHRLHAQAHAAAAAASAGGLMGRSDLRLRMGPLLSFATRAQLQGLRLQLALLDREFDDLGVYSLSFGQLLCITTSLCLHRGKVLFSPYFDSRSHGWLVLMQTMMHLGLWMLIIHQGLQQWVTRRSTDYHFTPTKQHLYYQHPILSRGKFTSYHIYVQCLCFWLSFCLLPQYFDTRHSGWFEVFCSMFSFFCVLFPIAVKDHPCLLWLWTWQLLIHVWSVASQFLPAVTTWCWPICFT